MKVCTPYNKRSCVSGYVNPLKTEPIIRLNCTYLHAFGGKLLGNRVEVIFTEVKALRKWRQWAIRNALALVTR